MFRWCVYGLVDPRTGSVRYVGKVETGSKPCDPSRRLREHLLQARRGNRRHVYAWIRTLSRLCFAPIVVVLETGSEGNAVFAERRWIADLRACGADLTNHTDGGDGPLGLVHSAETRAKLSATLAVINRSPQVRANRASAMRVAWQIPSLREQQRRSHAGKAPPNRGKKASPEACLALSIAHTGLKQDPETIAKRVAKNTGQVRTPDQRARISAGKRESWARKKAQLPT